MKEEPKMFTDMAPVFDQLCEVQMDETPIAIVKAFEPQLHEREIVLPMEFVQTDGKRVFLGFSLDREHLRELFNVYEFDEVIGEDGNG